MRRYFIVLLLLITAQDLAFSQTLAQAGDGKDFFVGYVQPSFQKKADSSLKKYFGVSLLISSYTNNSVTVSYFDKATGAEVIQNKYFILARNAIQIPLDVSWMIMQDSGDKAEFSACHIQSLKVANVMLYSNGPFSGGSYLAIQTPALGKRYVAASYSDNQIPQDTSRGFFLIVAPNDSTIVSINPTVRTLGGHDASKPYIVELNKGQCYLVKSATGDSSADISGSIISADKPIAVISGHENAYIGNLNSKDIEGRNYLVQQMMPDNILDTTGYISLPFADSSGQNYRIFSSLNQQVRVFGSCSDSTVILTNEKREADNLSCPVDLEALNGLHFNAIIYKRSNPAFPQSAAAMMSIMPISRWRNSFIWQTPSDSFATFHEDYINIISQRGDSILASLNGGPIKPISQLVTSDTVYDDIPLHPELIGVRYKLSNGNYYATASHPLMIYSYGNHVIIADSTNYFYSYASPAGFGIMPIYTKISVHVDTLGTSWIVCVHDSTFGLMGYGINSITLMDGGDCYQRPCPQFFNSYIDGDTNLTNDILYSPPDTDICFTISVNNIHDSAYAPIFIADNMGTAGIIELRYYPPKNSVPKGETESFPFSILPNLVTGNSLTVSLPSPYGNGDIIIYDVLGRKVLGKKVESGISQTQISVGNLRNGIYYARFFSEDFKAIQKFEIER